MRKQMLESAALDVATQVREVEEVIETALAEMAELQGRMVRARAAARVATATGHDAFEHLGNALQGLIAARGGIANCHGALLDAQRHVPGLRATSFGDAQECPKTATATLRIVA